MGSPGTSPGPTRHCALTDLHDDPRGLVTDDHRCLHDVRADAAVFEVVHIGPADPDGDDPNENLTRRRLGNCPVLDGELVGSVEDGAAVGHDADSWGRGSVVSQKRI